MNTRTKPDTLNIDDQVLEKFRNGSASDKAKKEVVTTRASGRDARISKTVRMRLRFSEMLRDEAFRRSRATGHKVSEADLIDEAMQEWRMKHDIPAE